MRSARETRTVFVVDDDDDFRVIFAELLGTLGFEVETAASGYEALEKLNRETPDLLFVDERMPGLAGHEVVERLRGSRFDVPVVLMSAAQDIAAVARSAGVDIWLRKPFALGDLTQVLARAVESTADSP